MAWSEGPDRGHAWVIAVIAGVITMILSGISKMVGILFVGVIEYYQVSREEATLPFTIRKSLRCLWGPIVGIIGQRFGIRAVTLVGAVVATLGAFLSFFAPTVTWLTICWGVIHGSGEAFANTLFQVVVNQYFEKYRSTASGIALSGACVGSVFFSFLIEFLREEYGLQGTFLILSGVMLHVIPAAILFKSPSWIRKGLKNPNENTNTQENLKYSPTSNKVPENHCSSSAEKRGSIASLNPHLLLSIELNSLSCISEESQLPVNRVTTVEKQLKNDKGFDNTAFTMEKETKLEKETKVEKETECENSLLKKRHSIHNVFVISKENNNSSFPPRNLSRQASIKELYDHLLEKTVDQEKIKSVIDSVNTIIRLYKNPVYLLICACMAAYVFIFIPVNTSMVDYSKDKGLPETVGKYLINTMAVGDIIGRVCFGWVTDKDFLSIPHYMLITLILQGIFILLIPFVFSLWAYLLLLALYAMTAGSMLVRLPVMVLKNVKKEEQPVAMGCYCFVSGLVPLGVPSLIGCFRDHFGSYNGMYYLLGGLSILSGCFWIFEPLLVRFNERLEVRRQNNINV